MSHCQKPKGPGLPPKAIDENSTISTDYPTALSSGKACTAKYLLVNAGFIVQPAQDGGFNVNRTDWGQFSYFRDVAELQAFALKLGVLHG